MIKSESIKNLSASLAKAQATLQNAKNTANNPFYKSKYAPLGDVLDLIRPVLAENGLAIVQYPSSEDGKTISVHTMLTHESGEFIDFDPLTLTAEKITPQGAGAAITYGRRYSVSGIFNIASEDDDDGNSLEKTPPKKIDDTKAQVVYDLLGKTNSDVAKFLKFYRVSKVEDMTVDVWTKATKALQGKLNKGEG
jgi:hypothetical protein